MQRGDVLVIATDGVEPDFADGLALAGSPSEIARRALERHRKPTDDALVLVLRYLGARS